MCPQNASRYARVSSAASSAFLTREKCFTALTATTPRQAGARRLWPASRRYDHLTAARIGNDQNSASRIVNDVGMRPATSGSDGRLPSASTRQTAPPTMIQENPDAIANQIAQKASRCQSVQLSERRVMLTRSPSAIASAALRVRPRQRWQRTTKLLPRTVSCHRSSRSCPRIASAAHRAAARASSRARPRVSVRTA